MVNKTRHLQMFACANAVQGFLARLKPWPLQRNGNQRPQTWASHATRPRPKSTISRAPTL